jgi:hypothetical protein
MTTKGGPGVALRTSGRRFEGVDRRLPAKAGFSREARVRMKPVQAKLASNDAPACSSRHFTGNYALELANGS